MSGHLNDPNSTDPRLAQLRRSSLPSCGPVSGQPPPPELLSPVPRVPDDAAVPCTDDLDVEALEEPTVSSLPDRPRLQQPARGRRLAKKPEEPLAPLTPE